MTRGRRPASRGSRPMGHAGSQGRCARGSSGEVCDAAGLAAIWRRQFSRRERGRVPLTPDPRRPRSAGLALIAAPLTSVSPRGRTHGDGKRPPDDRGRGSPLPASELPLLYERRSSLGALSAPADISPVKYEKAHCLARHKVRAPGCLAAGDAVGTPAGGCLGLRAPACFFGGETRVRRSREQRPGATSLRGRPGNPGLGRLIPLDRRAGNRRVIAAAL